MTEENTNEKKWKSMKLWLEEAIENCNEENCIKCDYGKQLLKTMEEMDKGEWLR